MRDVCFIADVAVLPRWMLVSQALDYVGGVHPRFDPECMRLEVASDCAEACRLL
jgi:ABC-2 type transport system ATP-binding protein